MPFDVAAFHAHLHTTWLGRSLEAHAELDSTSRVLKDRVRVAAPPVGQTLVADRQSDGYGQHGRSWLSAREGLYVSMWLPGSATRVPLTLAAGVATAETLRALSGSDEIGLKWVNDLVLRGRKLGGILAEGLCGGVVLGIGLNLDDPEPDEGIGLASLAAVPARELLLAEVLGRLESWLEAEPSRLCAAWSAMSVTLGQEVRVTLGQRSWAGVAERISDRGALILRLGDGSRQEIVSGTVRRLDGRYC